MRRLEYKDAKSHKFWELVVEGDSFSVRYGKVGTTGQTQTKTFASADKARAEGEKKLASKVKKGYVEVQVDAAAAAARDEAAPKRNPALEAALFDDPRDLAAWQVYGDWLQQQDDPHGELISLGLQREGVTGATRAKLDARIAEIESEHRDTWLGGAAKLIAKADEGVTVDLRWEHGYVVAATIGGSDEEPESGGPTPEQLVRALIKSPAVLFLRELTLGPSYDDGDWQGRMDKSVHAITRVGKLEALTSFKVMDTAGYWDISSTVAGKVGAVLPIAPRLRILDAYGGEIEAASLEHATLETLSFETGGLSGATAQALGRCKLPQLRSMTVYFGSSDYGGSSSMDHVRPLLLGEGVPKLEHLGLCNAEFEDELAIALATSPLLKQLRTLDLSQGTLHGPGVAAILAHADRFAHLERLNLADNFISDEHCAQIKAALPKVEIDTSGQEEPSDWGDRLHYYVSVGE